MAPARRLRRAARGTAVVAAALATALLAAVLAGRVLCGGDEAAAVLRVRGTYGGARIIAERTAPASSAVLLALRNDRGEEVAALWVRRPTTLARSYRVLLTYAGQATGERMLELIPDRPDLVLAAVQYPWLRPRTWADKLCFPRDARRAARRSVAGGMLAVSYLEEEETDLDLNRLTVVGASLGSVFATIHGALDPRVPRVLLVHGGGDIAMITRHGLEAEGWGWTAAPAGALAGLLFGSFDPVRWAGRISPRPLAMIAAREDQYFPRQSVEALFEQAREPKSLVWTESAHVRSRRPDIVAMVVAEIEAWLTAQTAESALGAAPPGPTPVSVAAVGGG